MHMSSVPSLGPGREKPWRQFLPMAQSTSARGRFTLSHGQLITTQSVHSSPAARNTFHLPPASTSRFLCALWGARTFSQRESSLSSTVSAASVSRPHGRLLNNGGAISAFRSLIAIQAVFQSFIFAGTDTAFLIRHISYFRWDSAFMAFACKYLHLSRQSA